jgi:hypothetical protein
MCLFLAPLGVHHGWTSSGFLFWVVEANKKAPVKVLEW